MKDIKEKQLSIREIIKALNENIGIVALIIAFLSGILQSIFRGFAYLRFKGKYDLWNIPNEFISIDYTSILYRFILSVAFIILILITSHFLYYYGLVRRNNGKRNWGNIIKTHLSIITYSFILLILTIIINYPVAILIEFIKYPKEMLPFLIVYVLMIEICVFSAGNMMEYIFPLKDEPSKDLNDGNIEKKDNKEKSINNRIAIYKATCIIVVTIIIGTLFMGLLMYNSFRNTYDNVNNLDIISINDDKFVLINEYKDKWIVKECFIDNNYFYINKEHFMIIDLEGKPVINYNIDKRVSLYFLSNLEYITFTSNKNE